MTPSDRQGAGAGPDEALQRAVAEALTDDAVNDTDYLAEDDFDRLARVALAAAGRVLAEGFKKRAAEVQVAIDNAVLAETPDMRRWIVMEETYRRSADLVLAACGLPPEGAGGGEGG